MNKRKSSKFDININIDILLKCRHSMTDKLDNQTPSTFSDAVFDQLRSDIVSGVLAPNARLGMKDLSARFAIGTSPIREALHRLAGEGLVDFVGQRGFRVPPLSLDDLNDLTELRLLVEEASVRQALARGDDAWESRVVAVFHQLERHLQRASAQVGKDATEQSVRDYDRIHRNFHLTLFSGVVSPRLMALHAHLFDQAHRYRKALHEAAIPPAKVLAEHKQIMRVMLSRDVAASVIKLCRHLELTRSAAKQHFRHL